MAGDVRTEAVRQFYEQAPFPAYPARDSLSSLRARAERSRFAALLDRAIPADARIVEVGCGTGQMSLYLARANREIVAVDLSRAALAARRRGGAALRHRQRAVRRDGSPPSRPEIRRLRRGVFVGGPASHAESTSSVCRARPARAARRDRRGRRVQHGRPRSAAAPKDHRTADRAASRAVRSRAAGASPRRRASRRVDSGISTSIPRSTLTRSPRSLGGVLRTTSNASEPTRARCSETMSEDLFAPVTDEWIVERWLAQVGWMWTLGGEGGLFMTIGRRRRPPASA